MRRAPIGFAGAFAVGAATGSFWTFGPLYAEGRSGNAEGVGLFMAACAFGGAVSQWPTGQLSDHVDRRWVLSGASLAAGGAGLLLASGVPLSLPLLCGLGALFGASALPLYSLCVAHANDRADRSSYIEVSSLLLLAFGVGATVGPFTSALLINRLGLSILFAFTACIHLLVAIFALYRIRTVEAAPTDERTAFAGHPPMGHGTQAMIELTPAADTSADGTGSRAGDTLEPVQRQN